MKRDILGPGKGFWVDPAVELTIKSKFLLTIDLKQKQDMQIHVVALRFIIVLQLLLPQSTQ